MVDAALYSSASDDWETPQAFFDKVAARFDGFDLDAAANDNNCKVTVNGEKVFYSAEDNALVRHWSRRGQKVWLNPPYGKLIRSFIAKAVEAYNDGCLVVCLVPARTDTAWWHDFVIPHAKVEFIRGRLKFGNATNSAPFPSALLIFDGRANGERKAG